MGLKITGANAPFGVLFHGGLSDVLWPLEISAKDHGAPENMLLHSGYPEPRQDSLGKVTIAWT